MMTTIKRFVGRRAFASIITVGAACSALDWMPILPEGWIIDELMWSAYVAFSGWMYRLGTWAMEN